MSLDKGGQNEKQTMNEWASGTWSYRAYLVNEKIMAESFDGFASTEDELRLTKRKLEETSITHYEETSALKKQIEDLNQKIREAKVYSDTRDIHLRSLEKEHTESQKEALESRKLVSTIQSENIHLRNKLSQLELALSEKGIEGASLLEEVDTLKTSLKMAEGDKSDAENTLRGVNDRLFQCQSEKESLSFSVSDLKEQLRSKDKQIDILQKELEATKNEVKSLNLSCRDQRAEVGDLRKKINEIEGKNRELTIELTDLKQTNAFLKKDIESSKVERNSALQRLRELEETQRINDVNIRHELDLLSKAENRMRQRCIEMEGLLSSVSKEKDQFELQYHTIESRTRALESRLVEVQDEKTEVEFQLSEICTVLRRSFALHVGNPFGRYIDNHSDRGLENEDANQSGDENDNISENLPFDPDELSEALTSWTKRLSALASERDEVKAVLELQQKKNKDSEESVSALRKTLEELTERIEGNERAKTRVEQQFERTEETLRLQEEEISRKNSEISSLVDENSTLQKQLSSLEMSMRDVEARATHVDEKSEIVTRDKLSLQKELSEMESRYSKMERSKRKVESELKKLQARSSDAAYDNETLRSQLETLVNDNKTLAEKVLSLEKIHRNIVDERTKNAKSSEQQMFEITRLRKELKTVEKLMKQKESALRESTYKIASIKSRLDDSLKSVATWKETCQALEKELEKSHDGENDLSERLKLAQKSYSSAEKRLVGTEEELNKTSRAFQDQAGTIEDLVSTVSSLQADKEELTSSLRLLQDQLGVRQVTEKELKESGKKNSEEIDKLKLQLNIKQRECDKLEGSLINVTEEKLFLDRSLRQLETDKENLSTQLRETNNKLSELSGMYELRYQEEARRDIEELKRENEKLKSRNRIMEEERDLNERSHVQKISTLEAQMSSLRLELRQESRVRKQLEDMYTRKGDEIDRFRSTFDRSLSNINKDTKNLKGILDKSLHKLDKQILVNQGLASDTDLTSDQDELEKDKYDDINIYRRADSASKINDIKEIRLTSRSPVQDKVSPAKRTVKGKNDAGKTNKNASSSLRRSPIKNELPTPYKATNLHRASPRSGRY